jgi:hypothetical protein
VKVWELLKGLFQSREVARFRKKHEKALLTLVWHERDQLMEMARMQAVDFLTPSELRHLSRQQINHVLARRRTRFDELLDVHRGHKDLVDDATALARKWGVQILLALFIQG